jgi:hypothetical protein
MAAEARLIEALGLAPGWNSTRHLPWPLGVTSSL